MRSHARGSRHEGEQGRRPGCNEQAHATAHRTSRTRRAGQLRYLVIMFFIAMAVLVVLAILTSTK